MTLTVGLAVITRNRAEKLRAMLASCERFYDQLVVVDSDSEDNTKEVVSEFGGEYHNLPFNKSALADMAALRNESFRHMTTDWIMWLDDDDLLQPGDGAKLKPYLEGLGPDIGGAWMFYHYAHDEYGNPSTIHIRERLMRRDRIWHWEEPVHEIPVPEGLVVWDMNHDVKVIHTGGHETRTAKIMPVLLHRLQENPNDLRACFYMAQQLFADGQWAQAAEWYTRYSRREDAFTLQRWQCMTYAARCFREMGEHHRAIRADFEAILFMPNLADGYLGVAESFLRLGEFWKGIHFGELALLKEPPNPILFVNTLDYSFRPYSVLSVCYAGAGQYKDAVDACNKALEVRPGDKAVLENREKFQAMLEKDKQVKALITLMETQPTDEGKVSLAANIGDGLIQVQEARDILAPALLRLADRGTQPRVMFLCGRTFNEWDSYSPETTGIGGSETALIEIASRFARAGWQAEVYCNPGVNEGPGKEGVPYVDCDRYRQDRKAELLVSFRMPEVVDAKHAARESWLWLHDIHYGSEVTEKRAAGYTRLLGVSNWHARYLKWVYPFAADRVGMVPNGLNLERFARKVEKQRFKLVSTSSFDRGLDFLLTMWPQIIANEPEAELHIFHSWATIDKLILLGKTSFVELKERIMAKADQKGLFWRGMVGQQVLADELMGADCWFYPVRFLETCCIGAWEAQAADLKIVASACGALPEAIGDAGVLVEGIAGSPYGADRFFQACTRMMHRLADFSEYAGRGPERAKSYTWDAAFERWKALIAERELVSA